MRKYRLVAKKGEGTFSEVLKAQNVKDGKYHAIKCMKNRFESIDQVNNLREIQALRRLSPHEHIITLEEVLYDQPTGRLALVFELMDANLYELIRGRRHYLNPQLIKSYIWQLMKSLDHMHKKGIFHRDIKPENILIESSTDIGRGLKLADFGSCRGIYSKQPYTEYISTRWYRAPECLLTDGYYGPEMDLWGAGCVMFEITSLYPLFPGSNEVDQISRIHKVLGTPGQDILQKFRSRGASHISFDFPPQKGIGIPQLIPHAAADGVDLMVKLLKYDAAERITAREALRHPYFRDIRETEQRANQAAQAGGASDNASVAGSVGIKSVSSNKTSASAAASVVQGGQMKMPQQGGAPIAKALPSIIGTGADGVQMPAQLNASQQMAMSKQPGLQAQYQQQQKQQQGMVGQGGQVGASALPPIGQQQQLLQQQQAQAQYQQQMQMQQQQQGQYGAGAQMQRAVQPSAALAGSARNEPNRRRKKYRMTYGQQGQAQGQAQVVGLQQAGGGVANAGAVDFRQNKRAGQEQVMRAYGVKGGMDAAGGMGMGVGMGVGMAQPKQGAGMSVGAGAGAGASYGSHPNRSYAPAKR